MTPCFLACALLLSAAMGLSAAEPVTRHHGRFEDFSAGTTVDVSISSDGSLRLAPARSLLAEADSRRIWRLLPADKALWIATGDDGKVFRMLSGGAPELVLDSPEIGIQALAPAGRGRVFAGTSPDGLVYRIDADGTTETVVRTEARYVWDLASDGDGLLVAAGSPAKVLRFVEGRSTTWFASDTDGHVRCLARAGKQWFAGTAVAGDGGESGARIYAIGPDGSRLLLETDFEEVTALVASGDTLFAAVTSTPASGDGDGPRSAVLRLQPGGAAWPLWQGEGVIVALLPARKGGLTAVLREPGRVLRLQPDGASFEQVTSVDSLVPNTAVLWRDQLVIGGGQSGRLVALSAAPADSGRYDSAVDDLGAHGHWGAIEWQADAPAGSSVRLHTRSGNSAQPDDSWSSWSAVLTTPGASISSPPGRYLQYRVILRGRTPALQRVSYTARQTNLPPRIESLTTFAYRGNPQAPGPLPPQPEGNGNGSRLPQSKSLRVVRWQASDANGDELRYRIYLRSHGSLEWKLVEQDLEQTAVFWDTERMPEGMTQLRLVASDAFHNPAQWALEDDHVSEPFAIDNSAPTVRLQARRQGDVTVVQAQFADAVTPVRGASYSLNYDDHGPRLAAEDGLFDSRSEAAAFRLEGLSRGEHVVSVQAWDQLDNVGVAHIVVRVD